LAAAHAEARAEQVEFLEDREPVIEITVPGESRVYQLQILIWHEIVNARFGETRVAVTFCPPSFRQCS
jgi:Protein of unknown function (DUF3179)